MSRRDAALLALVMTLLTAALGGVGSVAVAAGSWVATAPGVRVAMAEREVASAPLAAPAGLVAGRIETLTWRYRLAPGQAVRARLCHADGCLPLSGSRGSSQALAGLPGSTSLHFRFALAPGQGKATTVQGLQVIVNYR